ncbi:MAG: MarR family transcriptional regulator [Deltaproteobacteria bacterium]|nr:MarR family transcriptional regulator [Deltaproteobacteria bacterium]
MKTEWFEFSDSLGYLTLVTSRLFISVLGRKLGDAGLDFGPEQWAVLRMLLNEDGLSQEELLRLTRYEKSTLSRVLDGMEKKGLIVRKRDPEDGRRKKVFITPKGVAGGETGTEIAARNLVLLYEGIPREEFMLCRKMIEEMQSRLLRMLRGEVA